MAEVQTPELEQLIATHADWVYASARRRVGRADLAEDVAQAVFILLWRKWPGLKSQTRVTGWLYRAVGYCSANALRVRRIRVAHEREAAMIRPEQTATERWSDIEGELESAVDLLREKDREAILLRFYRGMSHLEVGQAMGVSEEAAKMRVGRAVERLRGRLEGRGVVASSAGLSAVVMANVSPEVSGQFVRGMLGGVGGGGSASAGVIAKGAMKMMVLASVKAAVGALLVLAAAVGAGVGVAESLPRPAPAASAPVGTTQGAPHGPTANRATTTPAITQEQVVAEIEKCGGKVQWGVPVPGQIWPTVSVTFDDKSAAGLTDAGLEHLKRLNQVQELHLDFTKVTDTGLGNLKGLDQLQFLSMNHTNVTDAGLEHLKGLTQLRVVMLDSTNVTDAGLEHLKGLSKLHELVLNSTKVTDAGLAYLKGFKQLQALALIHTRVTDAGLESLKGLNQLQRLGLGYASVTDAGLEHLKGLSQLHGLTLVHTDVTDAGLEHLKSLQQLDRLDLRSTKVTEHGMKTLQTALPKCKIMR